VSPRLHLVAKTATEERTLPLAVDPTPEGAVLILSPVVAVEIATALIKAGTPEQFARITAAACATGTPNGTGVALLAALLQKEARINLDRTDLRGVVDQLDDATHTNPADPALPDDYADRLADSWKDR